jgi:hypothetical protein
MHDNPNGRDLVEGSDRRNMRVTENDRGLGWIQVALDADKWRALVNTVINFLIPKKPGTELAD